VFRRVGCVPRRHGRHERRHPASLRPVSAGSRNIEWILTAAMNPPTEVCCCRITPNASSGCAGGLPVRCVGKVVGAFAGIMEATRSPKCRQASSTARFYAPRIQCFSFGEGLLDRIEIGRVRRQIPGPCAGRPDHAAECCRLVAAEIVHDDDVARLGDMNELLRYIGAEARKHSPLIGLSKTKGQ
jgi:hypothetical protein